MLPENPAGRRRRRSATYLAERRRLRRLRRDLQVNAAGCEIILHLRQQIVELQAQVQQLEVELGARRAHRETRLDRYREETFEATWYESPGTNV